RHIDIERRIDPGVAEKPHQHPVAEIQVNALADAREHEPGGDHQGSEHDRPAHADPLGNLPHRYPADRRTEPGERVRQCRHRANATELGRDLSATMVMSGAPKDTESMPSADQATSHERRVSIVPAAVARPATLAVLIYDLSSARSHCTY